MPDYKFKSLLAAGVSATALAALGAAPAHSQLLTMSVTEDAGAPVTATSSTGSLTFSPVLANFANITISSSGVPVETSPDLATTDLSADVISGFTGTHTLDVKVFQTGISAPAGTTMQSTFTVNNLIGPGGTGPGPANLFTNVNGLPLDSAGFAAGTISSSITEPPHVIGPAISADSHEFSVVFTAAGQSATDTIQLVGTVAGVPEPASLALLGTGLAGLGAAAGVRRRRRKQV